MLKLEEILSINALKLDIYLFSNKRYIRLQKKKFLVRKKLQNDQVTREVFFYQDLGTIVLSKTLHT